MSDDELKKQIKSSMQDMIEDIDEATQHQLNQARYQAINQAQHHGAKWRNWTLASTAALAFALVLVLFLDSSTNSKLQPENYTVLEDIELLANDSDPEFYQELEFLDWLEQNNLLDNEI